MKKNLIPDANLITSVANITYLTGYSNFSFHEREAYVILAGNKKYIITDARYSEAVKKHIPDFQLIERSTTNPLDKIYSDILKNTRIKSLGFEEQDLTVYELKKLQKYVKTTKLVPISGLIEKQRLIKKPDEIKNIQKACTIGDKSFTNVLNKLKTGVTEKEIAHEVEYFIKKLGADISFPPIVAFGKNSSIPHHQSGEAKLKKGDFVLLDFGAKVNNYCSDMTRTVFFGKATDEQKRIYKTVLTAQKKSIESLNTKYQILNTESKTIQASKIDKAARDYIIEQGYPSIPHSVGHGIGIEVHEAPHLSPNSKDELKPGMVFSVEPGIYIPGFGGVRIEDLVYFSAHGIEVLTKSPKHLLEVY